MNKEKNTSFNLQKSTVQIHREKKGREYQNNKIDKKITNENSYVINPSKRIQSTPNEDPQLKQNNVYKEGPRNSSAEKSFNLPNKSKNRFNIPERFKDGSKKIGFITAFLMLVLAVSFDAVQALFNLIPIIGNVLSSLLINTSAWISFYVWFKILGVDFSKPSRMGTMVGSGFIEMIPIVNALPAWTLAVVILIATTNVKVAVLK